MSNSSNRKTRLSLPVLQGLLPIDASRIPAELLAGMTLAALAVPEVMGYTKIAGTPVITGLYTILIPMALFALFGSSRHLVVGADSATAAILAAGLVGLAATGSDEYVALAGVLAFLAAGFLVLARIFGLGFLADFLSRTVLIGFLTGVGIQVALGQISGMLGLQGGGHGTLQKIWNDIQQIQQINVHALMIAIGVLVVIVGSRKVSKNIPGALIAVVGAIIASWGLGLGAHVHVLGEVPGGLPHIGFPRVDWSWALISKLVPIALAMFVVILAQSAATSRAYAARYNERFSENTDLRGSWTGQYRRRAVRHICRQWQPDQNTNGRQRRRPHSAFFAVHHRHRAAGAAVFDRTPGLSAGGRAVCDRLPDRAGAHRFRRPASYLLAAALRVLGGNIDCADGGLRRRRTGHPAGRRTVADRPYPARLQTQERAAGAGRVGHLAGAADRQCGAGRPGLMIYRFTHSMYYANSQQLTAEVMDLANHAQPALRWFCIDGSAVDDVDYSAAETLRSLHSLLKDKGIRLVVAQVMPDVKEESRYELRQLFGEDAFFDTLGDMITAFATRASAASAEAPTSWPRCPRPQRLERVMHIF